MKARLAASAALALGIAIGGSGCAMITYQATTEKYDPSDGVSADVGDLAIRNILVISEDGDEGSMILSVTNSGSEDATLELEIGGETLEVEVEAGQTVAPGAGDEDPLTVERLDAEVGGLVQVYATTSGAEGREIEVPVLDGRLPEYEDLLR
ncbi:MULTISPECIES: DNA modification methylase [unclassified Agromyces]|uniref:DNA modification methylase n=1 Tax=unclassified Agromyces TaxID=2639701 RepID=UPI003015808E